MPANFREGQVVIVVNKSDRALREWNGPHD
jgi:hypothetical protein